MKTSLIAAVAVILFLGLFRVEVTVVRKSAVDRRAEELTHDERLQAASKFLGQEDAAHLWAESTMMADCYRKAGAGSLIPDAEKLSECGNAIHEKALAFPFLSIKVASRLERGR